MADAEQAGLCPPKLKWCAQHSLRSHCLALGFFLEQAAGAAALYRTIHRSTAVPSAWRCLMSAVKSGRPRLPALATGLCLSAHPSTQLSPADQLVIASWAAVVTDDPVLQRPKAAEQQALLVCAELVICKSCHLTGGPRCPCRRTCVKRCLYCPAASR